MPHKLACNFYHYFTGFIFSFFISSLVNERWQKCKLQYIPKTKLPSVWFAEGEWMLSVSTLISTCALCGNGGWLGYLCLFGSVWMINYFLDSFDWSHGGKWLCYFLSLQLVERLCILLFISLACTKTLMDVVYGCACTETEVQSPFPSLKHAFQEYIYRVEY